MILKIQSHVATVHGYIQPEIKLFSVYYDAIRFSTDNKTFSKVENNEKYTYIFDGKIVDFKSWCKNTGEMLFTVQ